MESSTSNQPKLPLPRGDLVTTPRASVYRPSLSPDDGYDYKDTEPSPEGSATQEQDNVDSSKVNSQSLAVSNTTINHENHQGEKNPDYRRPAEGWRAKIPDDEDILNGVPVPNNSHAHNPNSPAVNRHVRRGPFHRHREATQSIPHEQTGEGHLRYVLLQWKKEELDGAERLVLNALSPGINARVESPNHVIWQ